MSATTARSVVEHQIGQLRAEADIHEAEARRLRVSADETDARAVEQRKLAEDLEKLLPDEAVE